MEKQGYNSVAEMLRSMGEHEVADKVEEHRKTTRLALNIAITYAQERRLPGLQVINEWRKILGWDPLESLDFQHDNTA